MADREPNNRKTALSNYRLEYEGARHEVVSVVLADGSCPAGTFLDSLDEKEAGKVAAIFTILGDRGTYQNRERFKKLTNTNLWEIKSYQIRIFCFFAPDRRLVLLDGVKKKKDKHKAADISRAEEYRSYYEEQIESGGGKND